jgi:hypothetical protein
MYNRKGFFRKLMTIFQKMVGFGNKMFKILFEYLLIYRDILGHFYQKKGYFKKSR